VTHRETTAGRIDDTSFYAYMIEALIGLTHWVEGDYLRCRYHGWPYGPPGQYVHQAAEPQPFCGREVQQ
jgi:hypothetical protein